MSETTGSVEVEGGELATLGWGADGERGLVVAVHGFPDHAPTFDLLGPALADRGFRVVAPYLRGYAPSVVDVGPYHPVAIARDLVTVVRRLRRDDEPVFLLGHDWGAVASYPAAGVLAEELAGLVTLAVPHGDGFGRAMVADPDQQRRSWYMYFFQMPWAEAAVAHDDHAFVERLWREWSPGLDPAPERMEALRETFRREGVVAAALSYYRDTFFPPALDEGLQSFAAGIPQRVPVPCLYLHGADDGCVGYGVSEGMEDAFAAPVERVRLQGVGHFLHLEAPGEVHRLVLAFLEDRLRAIAG